MLTINSLPSSSTPTCSQCSALLMNHLGSWSSNTTTLNSTIISSAASAINAKCGSNFVSVSAEPAKSASQSRQASFLSLAFVPLLAWAFFT